MANQLGVTYAVSSVPGSRRGDPTQDLSAATLRAQQQRFRDHGFELTVLETGFPMLDQAKYGMAGLAVERELDAARELIRMMPEAGVQISCWNWMAVFNWTRTVLDQPSRGGARVTAYDHAVMAHEPPAVQDPITERQLWDGMARFLEAVVPVAEEYGVTLAVHPDDPPISPIRNVGRILTSPDALQRVLDLVPSRANQLTFCQGSIATMNADIPAEIHRFGSQGKIGFVHFRDVRGTPEHFAETFHDDGQTDMAAAMAAYHDVGFDGPLRPDHVPTMAGETLSEPGYDFMGRLYAIGYVRGLAEATASRRASVAR